MNKNVIDLQLLLKASAEEDVFTGNGHGKAAERLMKHGLLQHSRNRGVDFVTITREGRNKVLALSELLHFGWQEEE